MAIHLNEIGSCGNLSTENDPLVGQPVLLGQSSRFQGALDHRIHQNFTGLLGFRELGVAVHQTSQQFLIQRTPVHSNTNRLVILKGHLDHLFEILIVVLSHSDVSGINTVLAQLTSALRISCQKEMSVVVKVSDNGDLKPLALQAVDDLRDRLSRRLRVHGDPNPFRPCLKKLAALLDGGLNICSVRVGHGLDHDGVVRTDRNLPYPDCDGLPAFYHHPYFTIDVPRKHNRQAD